jgi:hypothetical protein
MKVYISNYRHHWLSPYIILDKVFFWREIDYNEPIIEKWADRLEPFSKAWQKFLDFVHPRISYVKIDRWDTWSMDHTLADIILPMLKQLNEKKHGAPHVDDEDVPEELKSTSAPPKENEYDTDENHFKRWDWVMGEMIFAFECKNDDSWQEAFRSGTHDLKSVACEWDEEGKPKLFTFQEGPNHTYKCDYEGMRVVEERIQNGFRLFGKYYQNLWD